MPDNNIQAEFDVFGVLGSIGKVKSNDYYKPFYYEIAKKNSIFEEKLHDGRKRYIKMIPDVSDENGRGGGYFAFSLTLKKGLYIKDIAFLKALFAEMFDKIFADPNTGIVHAYENGKWYHDKNLKYGLYDSQYAKKCINNALNVLNINFDNLEITNGERPKSQSEIPEYDSYGNLLNPSQIIPNTKYSEASEKVGKKTNPNTIKTISDWMKDNPSH